MPKKIMVVDDSRIVQLQLQKILSGTEYEVIACCQSGEDALEQYGKVNPDLVTMDILMPGMDGLETARMILKEDPKARVLMVSSLAYDDTINEAHKIGAKGFVYKPFEREQVLASLQQAFAEP
ncbi:MAG TPA: response regulator [Candidatus Flavonifractor merdigallinarum]|uniref:Stage 0 sporulation protein A homolog n=1 Tax=Candidatus Flavonifractor merdigallinarum TaxID=2838589 RepID=A0A9D1Y8M5_9FIRM|nr:response regulator [Candidatus Flavonifractor merdigallinarum]